MVYSMSSFDSGGGVYIARVSHCWADVQVIGKVEGRFRNFKNKKTEKRRSIFNAATASGIMLRRNHTAQVERFGRRTLTELITIHLELVLNVGVHIWRFIRKRRTGAYLFLSTTSSTVVAPNALREPGHRNQERSS